MTKDTTVRVLSVTEARKQLPRIPQREMQAVRIQLRDKDGAVDTYTAHAVQVEGKWRWVLSNPFVRAVEAGKCPDGSPLP